MSVDLTHPLVADYLSRLDAAAAVLPLSRRTDLVAEIREHLTEALAGTDQGPDGELAVRAVLDRLGTPDEIVAAETAAGGEVSPLSALLPVTGSGGTAPPPGPPPGRSVWGPVEVFAVVGLTVGNFVLPVVGPLIGLVCVWVSNQWSRREKVVATLWAVVAPFLLAVLAMTWLFVARVAVSSDGTVEQAPQPVVSEQLSSPDPSEMVTP
jgi:hypothetical protein